MQETERVILEIVSEGGLEKKLEDDSLELETT